jgi:lipopolysaccharide/colanic/teichoic acid biosynthesis glycosyltransferase
MFRQEYAVILRDRPGITDPASLAFRQEEQILPRVDAEEVYVSEVLPRKIRLSMDYQRHRNFRSDMQILFSTVLGLGKMPEYPA